MADILALIQHISKHFTSWKHKVMKNAQTKFQCHRIFRRARGLPKHAYLFENKVAEK